MSAKSAAAEAAGRTNAPGARRKPILDLEDQLLVMMMRLRLGRQEKDLAYQFGVSMSCVSRITTMWLIFFWYLHLALIPRWEDVETTMPAAFKEMYPNTFAIIDATELKCETPSSLSLQSQLYS